MVLQTDKMVELHRKNIYVSLKSNQREIQINRLSRSKQIKFLLETEIKVTENQELTLHISQDGSNEIVIQFPELDQNGYSSNSDKKEVVYSIYSFANSRDFPWPYGKYVYEVTINHETFFGLLSVHPKNIHQDELETIHQYLEEQLKGITQNHHTLSEMINGVVQTNASHNQMINWFRSNIEQLMQAIRLIEKNHLVGFHKTYAIESLPKHLDRKSHQWNHSSRGVRYAQQKYYNRKHKITINSLENQLIKRQTQLILKELNQHIKKLKHNSVLLQDQITTQTKRLQVLTKKLEVSKQIRNLSDTDNKMRSWEQRTAKIELNQLGERHGEIVEITNYLQQQLNKFRQIMNNHFWKQVQTNIRTNKQISDKNYSRFYKLSRKFQLLQHDRLHDDKPTESYILHSTSRLYEFYTYFKLIECLQSLGFINIKQNKNFKIGHFFSELLPNTHIEFQQHNLKIDLVFDEEVNYSAMRNHQQQSYFYSAHPKRRPDIRMDLYVQSDTHDAFLYNSSIIFEVKYRPLSNIFSDIGYTEVMHQLTNYRNISHYCTHRNIYLTEIEDVICVYPGTKSSISFPSPVGNYLTLRPYREHEFHEFINRKVTDWLEKRKRIIDY